MNRLFVLGGVVVVALLAFRYRAPAAAPAISVASPVPTGRVHLRAHANPHVPGGDVVVYVVGAVARPGLYRVQATARVNDAVLRAGGLRANADPAAVNLAEHVSDGEEILVPHVGEAPVVPARTTRRKSTRRRTASSAPAQAVDLNAADAATLATIPGIGPTLAARIVAYRQLNGPFASLDELADVAGMTQRRIDAITSYVTL